MYDQSKICHQFHSYIVINFSLNIQSKQNFLQTLDVMAWVPIETFLASHLTPVMDSWLASLDINMLAGSFVCSVFSLQFSLLSWRVLVFLWSWPFGVFGLILFLGFILHFKCHVQRDLGYILCFSKTLPCG